MNVYLLIWFQRIVFLVMSVKECSACSGTINNEHFQNDEEEYEEESDEIDENDDSDEDIETFRLSEIEPALAKVELAMEKVNNLLNGTKLRCDICEFKAKNQNGLNMHKKAKHGDKST